jgi:hypothetical protein
LIRRGRYLAAATALSALCVLALVASAGANHSLKEELSIGPTGGNATVNAFFDGSSVDGTHAFFETSEPLVASDTDSSFDIYERVGNTTTLVSTGPSGGNGPNDAFFDGVSDDGSRVFFDTDEALVPADTDAAIDVYMRSGGTTTLITTGPAGGNGAFDVTFDGMSRDGSHVFFDTDEALVAGDANANTDIYDRSGGTTTLVTTGTGSGLPVFGGVSDDGTHAFFETDDALVAGDTDAEIDVYDRSGGTLTLVSTGPAGGNGPVSASYVGNSQSGAKVWFETTEALVTGDTDTGCGSPPGGCNDVYERSGGTTTQVSTPGNGAFDAFFQGTSLDGSHVFFETSESLVSGDTDTRQDVYERVSGTTTDRVSTGAAGGNGAFDAFFDGSSLDGTRVFFETSESLEASDTDTSTDTYERWNGITTHISIGPNGGNAALGAFFDGTTGDGTRVFFNTRESLVTGDTDTTRDVYAATVAAYPRPKGATPLRVSLVPAFQQCTSGNRTHGAPLAFGSCNPPTQASAQLTIGSPDANGVAANSTGSAIYRVLTTDVKLNVNITDVRLKAGLGDYTGQLQADAVVRITDRLNGPSQTEPATGTDTNFPVTVPCTATGSTTVGSTCSVATSFNAVTPGAIVASQRAVWQLGETKVFDGGPDGLASTGPNTLFERQGVFAP